MCFSVKLPLDHLKVVNLQFLNIHLQHPFSCFLLQAFVTCPLGVHMIGYVMMCFGACDAVSSFIFGRLQKCIARGAIICTGT